MTYLFLVHHNVARPELAAALAELLSLPVTAVDVGDQGELDRNWDRPISCTVTPMAGDLRLHLDMYFAPGTVSPSDEEAAAWLAARLDTLVAYHSVASRPSAYWLVGPDGRRTRARLDNDDYDENEQVICRIVAAEAPVPMLPATLVTAIPEVIHEYRMPTPLADALEASLEMDSKPIWYAINCLAAWEGMVTRLTEGWLPDGWYPPDYYRDSLDLRDRLTDAGEVLPIPIRPEFVAALDTIDCRFTEATVDDGGEALAAATGPVPDRWWWRRITDPLPWHSMPTPAFSELPEPLRARAEHLVGQPAIEKVRGLLHVHVQDAGSLDEIRHSLRSAARVSTFFLQQRLDALETMLSEPQPAGTLLHLVEQDADWAIDHDQTDQGAVAFLRRIANLAREVIMNKGRST